MQISPVCLKFPNHNYKSENTKNVSANFTYATNNLSLNKDTFKRRNSNIHFGSNDTFTEGLTEFLNTLIEDEIHNYMKKKFQLEAKLKIIMDVSNRHRQELTTSKGDSEVIAFLARCLRHTDEKIDDIKTVFKRNNIKYVSDFTKFLSVFYSIKNPDIIFENNLEEAIDIYGILENKQNLIQAPELLLEAYADLVINENLSEDEIIQDLNKYAAALKDFNIKDEKGFKERFEAISPYFNDFESASDKFIALDYMSETYEYRIDALERFKKQHPDYQIKDPKKTYEAFGKYIDWAYEADEDNLEGLQDYYNFAIKEHKTSNSTLMPYRSYFNDFQNIGDKIAFWTFLTKNNIDYSELGDFSKAPSVEGAEPIDAVKEKGRILKVYFSDKFSSSQATNYYKNNYKILISLDKHQENNGFDAISFYIDFSKKYKINSFNEFLKLYNSLTNSKVKTLSSKEIYDFVELFRYETTGKTTNKEGLNELKNKKLQYSNLKSSIENYLDICKNDFYLGNSSLDIFLRYYNSLAEQNPSSIEAILDTISTQSKPEENSEIKKEIAKFSAYFDSEDDAIEFIKENKIQLEAQGQNSACLKDIYRILDSLKIIYKDKDLYRKAIDTLTNNKILSTSQNSLTAFLKKKEINANFNEIVKIIIEKNIDSIEELESFIDKYSTDKINRIIKHILNSPENMDFKTYKEFIENFENRAKCLRKNFKITDNNISKIGFGRIDINIANFFNSDSLHPLDILKGTNLNSPLAINKYDYINDLTKRNRFDPALENLIGILNISKPNPKNTSLQNIYVEALSTQMPDRLLELLDYFNYALENKIPNISQHAKLRILARFILTDNTPIEQIDMQKAKNDIKNLLENIYCKMPESYKIKEDDNRILFKYKIQNQDVECLFSPDGCMVTIYPKDNFFLTK